MRLLEQLQPLADELRRSMSDSPVMLPPGRARLATSPVSTGSPMIAMTIGNRRGRALGGQRARRAVRDDDVDLEPNQLGCQAGQPLVSALRPPVLDDDVPALDVAEIAKPCRNGLDAALEAPARKRLRSRSDRPSPPAAPRRRAARRAAPAERRSRNARRSITRSPDPPAPAATAGS